MLCTDMGMTSLFSGREANSASVRRIDSVRSALARPMMLAMLIRAKEIYCQVSPVVAGSKGFCREEDEQADFAIFSRVVLSQAKARPKAQRFST